MIFGRRSRVFSVASRDVTMLQAAQAQSLWRSFLRDWKVRPFLDAVTSLTKTITPPHTVDSVWRTGLSNYINQEEMAARHPQKPGFLSDPLVDCAYGSLRVTRAALCFGNEEFAMSLADVLGKKLRQKSWKLPASDKDKMKSELELLLKQETSDLESCNQAAASTVSYMSDEGISNFDSEFLKRKTAIAELTVTTIGAWKDVLSSLPVCPISVNICLAVLIGNSRWNSAARLVHVFPGLISKERVFTIIEKLLASPIDDDNIVASGQLLETAFLMTKNHPKASKLSREQHLQELLKEFILRCIESSSNKSLAAAAKTADTFEQTNSVSQLLRNAKERADCMKYLTKNKWQVLLLLLKRKLKRKSKINLEKRIIAYDCCLELGLYAEAKEFYYELELFNHSSISPVSLRQLQEQKLKNESFYLQFPLDQEKIIYVDSEDALHHAAERIGVSMCSDSKELGKTEFPSSLKHKCVVGLDAEWKFSGFGVFPEPGASILQIATSQEVFILDMRALCCKAPCMPGSLKSESRAVIIFIRNLMRDPRIIKVGWDFLNSDVVILKSNGKGALADAVNKVFGYVELSSYVKKIDQLQKGDISVASLSGACYALLGRPLHKSEQMSDWDKRPLSKDQLIYASMDAHSSLALFNVIQSSSNSNGITTVDGRKVLDEDPSCRQVFLAYERKNKPTALQQSVLCNKPIRRRG